MKARGIWKGFRMSFFMHRGQGPLLSVLLPSRGRPKGLVRAIDSFWSLAQDKSLVEFVVKLDDDDTESIRMMEHLAKGNLELNLNLNVIISPREEGYRSLDKTWNSLAAAAKGDWFYLFNDDAYIKSENWDQLLLQTVFLRPWFGAWKVCCLWGPTIDCDSKQMPILRREVYEIWGHITQSPIADTWIWNPMEHLRMCWKLDGIQVVHDKEGMVRDSAKSRLKQIGFDSDPTLHSLEAKEKSVEDAAKIIRWLKKYRDETAWFDRPNKDGWWFWDANIGAEGNLLVLDKGRHLAPVSDDHGMVTHLDIINEDQLNRGRFCLISAF